MSHWESCSILLFLSKNKKKFAAIFFTCRKLPHLLFSWIFRFFWNTLFVKIKLSICLVPQLRKLLFCKFKKFNYWRLLGIQQKIYQKKNNFLYFLYISRSQKIMKVYLNKKFFQYVLKYQSPILQKYF